MNHKKILKGYFGVAAKKVVRKTYANCGRELVIIGDRATGPPGAATGGLSTAL
jgi:hypothetical protein